MISLCLKFYMKESVYFMARCWSVAFYHSKLYANNSSRCILFLFNVKKDFWMLKHCSNWDILWWWLKMLWFFVYFFSNVASHRVVVLQFRWFHLSALFNFPFFSISFVAVVTKKLLDLNFVLFEIIFHPIWIITCRISWHLMLRLTISIK